MTDSIHIPSGEMQISEAELRGLTAEMVEMHESTFPALQESLGDVASSIRARTAQIGGSLASRRSVLMGTGALAGGLLLTACGGSDDGDTASGGGTPTGDASASADKAALTTNAGIEALAVFAYTSTLTDAGKNKFGKVPAAVADFATIANKQHTEHQAAFNAALKKAGGTPVTAPPAALATPVLALYKPINSVAGIAGLARVLENTAAATYINQLSTLMSADAVAAVATIAPVERQHAAILSYVLGEYPVPTTFVDLTKSATSLGAL